MIPKSGLRRSCPKNTSAPRHIRLSRIRPEMAFALGPRALSAGYRLAAFDHIGSTNAEAMTRARDGERGPTWFVTSEQTAGRGRRHRPWIAPRGNLASSILEVIDVSPAVAATLGFAAGLALEAALQKVSIEASLKAAGSDQMKFSLKWPNDVLAGRQKLAGILLEAETVADNRLAVVVGTVSYTHLRAHETRHDLV